MALNWDGVSVSRGSEGPIQLRKVAYAPRRANSGRTSVFCPLRSDGDMSTVVRNKIF
jgi:hypothetical protein